MSVLLVLFSVFAVFLDRMWKKLPTDHPAVYPANDADYPTVGSEQVNPELTSVRFLP
jgi:hypothetical protein